MQPNYVLVAAEAPAQENSIAPADVELLALLDGDIPHHALAEFTDVLTKFPAVKSSQSCT